jgi:uncharacterized protein (DUF885 family)
MRADEKETDFIWEVPVKKYFIGMALIIILAVGIWTYKLFLGRPCSFNHAVERITLQSLMGDPEMLTYLGFIDNTLLDFHSGKLTDSSPAHERESREMAKKGLVLLQGYDRSGLSRQEQLTDDIFSRYLRDQVESERFPYHLNNVNCPTPYPVNQLFGVQSEVPAFLESMHRITGKKSADRYIQRLRAFRVKFDQVLESLRMREAMKAIPPRFVVTKVINQMESFIAAPPSENILYTSFAAKIDACRTIDREEREKLKKQALQDISSTVYPAYGKLIAYMKDLKMKTGTDDGVWKLPDGDAYYAWILRWHITTDMTPESVHELGLAEVKRIESEMREILQSQGYTGAPVSVFMNRLAKEKRFLYPDTAPGKEQVLRDYEAIVREMEAGVKSFIATGTDRKVEVKRLPVFKEATSPTAYYNPPSMDGGRPGIFYVNLRNTGDQVRFGMRTLAYHEAVPGHHTQLAIAMDLKGVPMFRKVYPFTAYVEGWALYAERLAWEQGYQDDPFSNLGRLQAEMFRAVRLVVDTGIHRKKWTRERAIAYMLEKTGMSVTDVTAEIERYIVMPGQACAYKIGMIKLLEYRERMKRELGSRFDIRKFHDLILLNGSMPLDILDRVISGYIEKEKGL